MLFICASHVIVKNMNEIEIMRFIESLRLRLHILENSKAMWERRYDLVTKGRSYGTHKLFF